MNLAQGIYTEDEVLLVLRSSSRRVYYRYTVKDTADHTIGELDIQDGRITFDSTQSVMRTFSGTVNNADTIDLNCVDYRLIPWFCLEMGQEVLKYPLGKFIISPTEDCYAGMTRVRIVGYDLGKVALDYYEDNRYYLSDTVAVTNAINGLLDDLYAGYSVEQSSKRTYPSEWNIGTCRLNIINDLAKMIGYNPLYFDEVGNGYVTAYQFASTRDVEAIYRADDTSIITDGVTRDSGMFAIANKYVRWVEEADQQYYISSYTNDDPDSPYSTITRGRTIVDAEAVSGITSQEELDAYTLQIAEQRMQAYETLQFKTLNMPNHGFKTCLWVDIPAYNINGKYVETGWEMDLVPNGTMVHNCSRVVDL